MQGNCCEICRHQFTKYMLAKMVKIVCPKCCKATLLAVCTCHMYGKFDMPD